MTASRRIRPRRLRRAGALLAGLSVWVTGGCSLFGDDEPATSTATTTTSVPGGPTVTLLDAGAEPRRVVEVSLTAGATVDVAFSVDLHLTQRTGPEAPAQVVDPPATTQTVRLTVQHVDPRGADVHFEVVDAGIDADDADAEPSAELTAAVREVVGLTGTLRVDPSGRLTTVDYEPPATLDPTVAATLTGIEDSLADVVAVLPTEPIGRGARWRTVSQTSAGGIATRQTVTYEITELGDDHLLYTAEVTQTAGEQDLDQGPDQGDTTAGTRLLAADLAGTTTAKMSLVSLEVEADSVLQGTHLLGPDDDRSGDPSPTTTQQLDLTVTVRTVGP